MLSERFGEVLAKIKNPKLLHPVFYNCPVAVRFEIGGEIPVYLDDPYSSDLIVNPEYLESAFQRAKAIYTALSLPPNLLRIDFCKENESENIFDLSLFQKSVYSFPHEKRQIRIDDEEEQYTLCQLYWDLCKIDFSPDQLLKEIIKADLGGISALASNVYFVNTEKVYLYHLYDDKGADLVAERTETLYPFYHTFNGWILDCNRKEIDSLFTE